MLGVTQRVNGSVPFCSLIASASLVTSDGSVTGIVVEHPKSLLLTVTPVIDLRSLDKLYTRLGWHSSRVLRVIIAFAVSSCLRVITGQSVLRRVSPEG